MKNNILDNLYHQFLTQWTSFQKKEFPTWQRNLQKAGHDIFLTHRLPTKKSEAYRYTPIASKIANIFNTDIQLNTHPPTPTPPPTQLDIDGYHFVLHNGHLHLLTNTQETATLFTIDKLTNFSKLPLTSHTAILGKQDGLVGLNTSFWQDGAILSIKKGTKLTKPIIIRHHISATHTTAIHPRLICFLEQGAEATIIEHVEAPHNNAPVLYNKVTEITLATKAIANHYLLQVEEAPNTYQFHHTYVTQDSHSKFHQYTFSLAGSIIRNALTTRLQGSEAEAQLKGAYLTNRYQYIEHCHKTIHAVANTNAHTHYKAIAMDKSKCIFNGYIQVDPIAQETKASQYHHGILVGKRAHIYARPQLGIEQGNITCQHGATMGEVDEDQLFALRARGLDKKTAHNMLLKSFVSEIIGKVSSKELHTFIQKCFSRKFAEGL